MKKLQYNYLPADSGSAGSSRETKKSKSSDSTQAVVPPDEATVARLNAIAREYPFCAWGKPKHNTLL